MKVELDEADAAFLNYALGIAIGLLLREHENRPVANQIVRVANKLNPDMQHYSELLVKETTDPDHEVAILEAVLHVKKQLEQEAENRRKLLATLEPGARKFAIECFAQLGLYQ